MIDDPAPPTVERIPAIADICARAGARRQALEDEDRRRRGFPTAADLARAKAEQGLLPPR
jgi:hypothetical protein